MSSVNPQIKRIAVVAVHGIANQSPGETLHAVSNALLRLNDSGDGISYAFNEETTVRIPVQKVEVTNAPPAFAAAEKRANGVLHRLSRPFNERSEYVQSLHRKAGRQTTATASAFGAVGAEDYAHNFMREQLRNYKLTDADRVYETQRLVSQRRDKDRAAAEVHLYEMYWADLSRLRGGVLQFFGELYQLLFHLSSLGRQTIDFALAEHVDDASGKTWRVVSRIQGAASWLLTRPIPILNLLMLIAILVALVGAVPEPWPGIVSFVLVGGIAAIAAVTFLYHDGDRRLIALLGLPAAAIIIALSITSALDYGRLFSYEKLVALLAAAIASVAFVLLMKAYDRRRPGAMLVAACLGIPTLLAIFALLIVPSANALTHMLWIIEFLFALLGLCWIAISLLSVAALVTGFAATRATAKVGNAVSQSRAQRAVATALMTLSIPSIGFLIITIALYWGFETALKPAFDLGNPHYDVLLKFLFGSSGTGLTAYTFTQRLIEISASPGLFVVLLLLILAGACAVIGLVPAILFDVRPGQSLEANTDPLARSKALGSWLDSGYQLLLVACIALFLAFPIVYGASVLLWSVGAVQPQSFKPYVIVSGALLAAGGGLMAFHGQLQKLALGFRPALDAVLDIDNYMREHPLDQNPRSRICARYVSLLRYLSNWTDPRDGGKYSRLVIVSHSQGTVISAELLRFLNNERANNGVARLGVDLSVRLLTMGCPLRQLYGWRFPHLYQWARHTQTETSKSIPTDQLPNPSELKVERWVNAYCSGDYVGRYLWRTDDSANRFEPAVESIDLASPRRKELCIGAGAHNHYFDSHSDAIRNEIDKLIAGS